MNEIDESEMITLLHACTMYQYRESSSIAQNLNKRLSKQNKTHVFTIKSSFRYFTTK